MKEIEILLVDDGSTDSSGDICDKLANKYTFVKAYHKKNGGLSDARNYGIQRASGEWISLIDSDDVVVKDYLNTTRKIIKSGNSDIFIFKYKKFNDGTKIPRYQSIFDKKKLHITSKQDAMKSLTNTDFGNYAWNKIYRSDLFKDIKYPVGKGYEDIFTTFLLYESATSISVYNDVLYFYRQRRSSIVYQRELNKKLVLFKDRYMASKLQNDFFKEKNYDQAYYLSMHNLMEYALILVTYIDAFNQQKDEVYNSADILLNGYSPSIINDGFKDYLLFIFRRNFNRLYNKLMHRMLRKKVK